ncbi:N-acetylmuramoyl-L-alanine amidase [Marinibacterium sp. SX1]|uniref:N-acetylmuramoyl-L-alanine amidase n=1 Tax=Marinibacterium sp. SX1 TaxID=3388424 RepID=UPI003D173068
MPYRSQTRAVQEAVASLGHDPGPVDGHFGAKTLAGVESWLAAKGEPMASIAAEAPPLVDQQTAVTSKATGEIRQGSAGHLVDHVMLHTAATPGSWPSGKTNAQMLAEIRRWHVEDRGWSDIGYHFVVFPDGAVLPGRPVTRVGAGCKGVNSGVIHICMIPSHTITGMGRAGDFYTPACIAGTRAQIADIARLTPITRLSGHNEHAAKLCPGFRVRDEDWTDLQVA